MFLTILINLISVFIFLYILWNKLKEEYSASLIFSAGFTITIAVILGNIIAFRFFPQYWFWASFLGVFLGTIISVYRYRFSFFEFVDSVVISIHPWLGLIFLDKFASSLNVKVLLLVFQTIITAVLYMIFNKKYKSYTWYRSGRIGFAGFSVLGIYFILRSIIALTLEDMVSFIGLSDAIISGVVSFMSFLMLLNLSRSKI